MNCRTAVILLVLSAALRADPFFPLETVPRITSPLDPGNYVMLPPSAFDGVAKLIISMPSGNYGCSGTLLTGGQYLVTAAHCVTDGGSAPAVNSLSATFYTAGGPQTFSGAGYFVPTGWDGDYLNGSDIALVRLSAAALGITSYELWRGADPWGATVDVAGYGLPGTGAAGASSSGFGTLRAGQNTLDPVIWTLPGFPYAWDFDDGTSAHDALCILAGVCHAGLGDNEVMIAPGDSGGPMFFGGYLGGVHSFGATFGWPIDVDDVLNSSFGELAGNTRVNAYAPWIDSIVAVPEPGTITLLGLALVPLLASAVRRFRALRARH